MTDTEARALLRRLDEAWRDGGEASHSFEVLTQVLREARALLVQPAPEGAKPQGPLKQYIRWPYVGEDGKWHIGELDVESPRVTRFFLDGAPMKIAPEGNQCDGCRAGMPLHEGVHYRDDHPHICCTADRYTQPAPEGEDASELSNAGVFLSPEDNLVVFVNHRSAVESVTFKGARLKDVTLPPTPPAARVEALDFETAVLRLERAVRRMEACPEGDPYERWADYETARAAVFAAYRPLPRAEAEAMVEGIFRTIRVRTDGWTVQDTGRKETWNRLEYEDWQATTRAALLRALTGEGT